MKSWTGNLTSHDHEVELGNNHLEIPDNEVETRQSSPSMCCFHLWFWQICSFDFDNDIEDNSVTVLAIMRWSAHLWSYNDIGIGYVVWCLVRIMTIKIGLIWSQ